MRGTDEQIRCCCVWINYTIGLVAAGIYLCGSIFLSFSFSVQQFSFCLSSPALNPFHLHFLLSYLYLSASFILFHFLFLCHTPHFPSIALVFFCFKQTIAYSTKGLAHQHLSGLSFLGIIPGEGLGVISLFFFLFSFA